VNDAYAACYDLGSPKQLTKQQENHIKNTNNGVAIEKLLAILAQLLLLKIWT
jgi:hypothetical protein